MLAAVCNFTPVVREGLPHGRPGARGVGGGPEHGQRPLRRERDREPGGLWASPGQRQGRFGQRLRLTLPPLGVLYAPRRVAPAPRDGQGEAPGALSVLAYRSAARARGTSNPMRLWMDVMRHLEPVVDDHERLFDAWEAGGVDGIVVGPLAFADKTLHLRPRP